MKVLIFKFLLSCVTSFSLIGCGYNSSAKFTINVINGFGSGEYDAGATATISAAIPEDKLFDYWSVDGANISTENPYSFTVTKDAIYTANFKEKTMVNIQVTNGTGSGTYEAGSSVTITANTVESNTFDYWKCNEQKVSSENPYTFTATEDAIYTAVYKAKTVDIRVTNGSGSGTYNVGSRVTITANTVESKIFSYWQCNGKKVSTNNPYAFIATENATFTAIYKTGTVSIQVSNGTGGGTYNLGASVTITANEAPESKCFDYWQSNGKKVSTNNPYTFTATENASFTAIYRNINRGTLKTGIAPIDIKPINVSEGGTIVIDYKYVDPIADKENGVSIFFGSDTTYRFGNYKIFNDKLEKTYNGVAFTALDDGYYRLTIDVSKLDQVRSGDGEIAPTIISQIMFKWFEPGNGVYFDINPGEKKEKTTVFTMEDDEFVIANYTDIHVDDSCNFEYLIKTIEYGIGRSNPDIMIFSGDLAGSATQLNKTCTYLDSLEIPYFFILGNHDHQYLGYDTIEQRLTLSDYGYIEKGPDELGSQGNYTIKIKNSDGNIVHGLVMMDSGDRHEIEDESKIEYVTNKISNVHYGEYNGKTTYCAYSTHWDGIRGNQIDWYADKVDELNCETTLVCHIPFLEYCKAFEQYQDAVNKKDQKAIDACEPIGGCHMGEAISGSIENLGMFDKILEKNSTKNVICGHDHVNDFSLLYQGVRLTYAVKTGNGAYWQTDGSRCGYTELKISSSGQATLDQVYFNPINK